MYYYRHDLALIHDRGHGQHADRCAPGIIELLSPVRGGLVLELGCGSGALTRHLLAAGFQVIATDGSGAWRRDHERHENVLVDTSRIPPLLREHGVDAVVGSAFGDAELPLGMVAVTGRKDIPRRTDSPPRGR
jgi:SAM-dependent methyltransferase